MLANAGIVPHQVASKLSEETEAEMLRRAADEEAYKRTITEKQVAHAFAGRALDVAVNLTQLQLCQAESHAVKSDLDLARATRRAALDVLKSYLEAG